MHIYQSHILGAATRVIGAMRKELLERRELKKEMKLQIYNAMVVPTLLYGCETWTMQKRHEVGCRPVNSVFAKNRGRVEDR